MAGQYGTAWARFVEKLEVAFRFPKGRYTRVIMRPRYPRVIAGVCSGLAEYYGWDAALLRVLVVVLAVVSSGLVALGYMVAWVLIPKGQYGLTDGRVGKSSF